MQLKAMNVTAQTARTREPWNTDSPINIVTTPLIIGLRTYRYGPTATSRCVGSHGASVPFPTRANSEMHHAKSAKPHRKIRIPEPRPMKAGGVAGGQPVSDIAHARNNQRGTTTTTTNGSSRMEIRWRRTHTADPIVANARFLAEGAGGRGRTDRLLPPQYGARKPNSHHDAPTSTNQTPRR